MNVTYRSSVKFEPKGNTYSLYSSVNDNGYWFIATIQLVTNEAIQTNYTQIIINLITIL